MNEHLLAAQANIVDLFTHWLRWNRAGFNHIFGPTAHNPQPAPIDPLTSGQAMHMDMDMDMDMDSAPRSTQRTPHRVHLPRSAAK